jgi:hypothetical protein
MGSLRGNTFVVNINTGSTESPTWTEVKKMNAFDKQSTRSKTTRPYFGSALPDTTRGPRETTLTMGGTRDLEDPGQIALYAALTADPETDVELQIMHDDDNGYIQSFQIDDDGFTTAPDGFQDFTLSLSPTSVPETVDES